MESKKNKFSFTADNDKTKNKKVFFSNQVYIKIKEQIVSMQLRPGEILLIQTLAKQFGLSRTPIKEALVRLKQEGLVKGLDGTKYRVSDILLEEVLEIYEIRKILEGIVVSKIAAQGSPAQVKELKEIQVRMREAFAKNNYEEFFELDLRFHEKTVHFYGNKTLENLLKSLNDKVQRIRYLTINIERRIEKTLNEHNEILEKIACKDAQGASKALGVHLLNVTTGLKRMWSRSPRINIYRNGL